MKGLNKLDKLIERIESLNNTQHSLGWGHSDFVPVIEKNRGKLKRQVCVALGHKIYKVVHFLIIEELEGDVFRLSVMDGNALPDTSVIESKKADDLLKKVVELLKAWYPEIRR